MNTEARDTFRTLATRKAEQIADILAPPDIEVATDDDKVQVVMSGMCAIFMVLDLAAESVEGDEPQARLQAQVEALSNAFIVATTPPSAQADDTPDTDDDQS